MIDIILRFDDDLGFLPILELNGKEKYRGEYQQNATDALERCMLAMRKISKEMKDE